MALSDRAKDLLDRMTDREFVQRDPVYRAQVLMITQALVVLEEALRSCQIPWDVAHDVMEKFVFGTLPSTAQAYQAQQVQEKLSGNLAAGVVPHRLSEALDEAVREARG